MTDQEPPPDDHQSPIQPRLLLEMHACGQRLVASDSLLLRTWGEHLLQDWRSLELLAERYRK